jgi:ribonuclease HI
MDLVSAMYKIVLDQAAPFVFRPETHPNSILNTTSTGQSTRDFKLHTLGYANFSLENQGPHGEIEAQTSNRAELRALIGALQFRLWHNEGFNCRVTATDSSYTVDGATDWMWKWQ